MLIDFLNVAHPRQPRLLFRSVIYQNWAGHPERGFNLFLSCNHLVLIEQFVICHQINNTSGHLTFLKSQQLLFQVLLDLCTSLQGSSTCSMDPNEALCNFHIHTVWTIITTHCQLQYDNDLQLDIPLKQGQSRSGVQGICKGEREREIQPSKVSPGFPSPIMSCFFPELTTKISFACGSSTLVCSWWVKY